MFKWFRQRGENDAPTPANDATHPVEAGPAFFVPGHGDRADAAAAVETVAERMQTVLKQRISPQRFAALVYQHDGFRYRSDVGQTDPRTGETVVCILHQPDARQYLICTPKRGAEAGLPLLVGDGEVERAVVFQDA